MSEKDEKLIDTPMTTDEKCRCGRTLTVYRGDGIFDCGLRIDHIGHDSKFVGTETPIDNLIERIEKLPSREIWLEGVKYLGDGQTEIHPQLTGITTDDLKFLTAELARLTRLVEIYKGAVEHYADKDRWTSHTGSRSEEFVHDKYWGNRGSDNGYDIAQAAIEAAEKVEGTLDVDRNAETSSL